MLIKSWLSLVQNKIEFGCKESPIDCTKSVHKKEESGRKNRQMNVQKCAHKKRKNEQQRRDRKKRNSKNETVNAFG